MKHFRACVVACFLLAVPLTNASAQQPAGSAGAQADDPMSDKARELFIEGKKLYREAKYPQAEASFEAAWGLSLKSKGIAGNLGDCEMKLGKYREAAEHLAISLRLAGPNDPQRARTADNFAAVKAKVGTIVLTANPAGAEVLLDGKKVGDAPLLDPVFVDPGHVKLRVRMEGFVSWEKELDVTAGQEVPLDVTLEKPAPVPTATATVAPTVEPPSRSMAPAYVIGGVGVASLIVGGVLLGVVESKRAEIRAAMPLDASGKPACGETAPVTGVPNATCERLRAEANGASVLGNAGVGVLIFGGAALAGAAAYWLWPTSGAGMKRGALVPIVSPSGAGLHWVGSF